MPAWKANTSVIRNQSEEMKNLASRLSRMSDSVMSSGNLNGIHFEGQAAVEIRIRELGSNLQIESSRVSNLGSQLSLIAQLYEANENQIKSNAGGISKITRSAEGGGGSRGGSAADGSANTSNTTSASQTENEFGKNIGSDKHIWDIVKQYFKMDGKVNKNDHSSMINKALSYWENLSSFLTGDKKGWNGISDLCDLTKSSSELWTALYKAYEHMDKSDLMKFSWGPKVAALGIFSSSAGLFGKIAEAIGGDNSTGWNIASNFFDAGSGVFDVGKSIYEFKNFAELANKSQGLWTSAGQWATLGETVTSTFSQAFKSIGEYSADGKWDLGDTAATGIDSAVVGLEKLISGVTFGTISAKTFGTSTDEMSKVIKNTAGKTGENAGNYILKNKDMLNKYQNGNVIEKVGITFVATAASWMGW